MMGRFVANGSGTRFWRFLFAAAVVMLLPELATACDKAGIRKVLLWNSPRDFESKLAFIREKRDFAGCGFSFEVRYDVNLYYRLMTTVVDEIRFYESSGQICVERYNLNMFDKNGSKKTDSLSPDSLLPVSKGLIRAKCISSTKEEKRAQGLLLDLFKRRSK